MNLSFWQERWLAGRLGFHRDTVHPRLTALGPEVFGRTDRVLVPLCGKSLDLWWLSDRCQSVSGIEFVPEAAGAFFAEAEVTPAREGAVASYGNLSFHTEDFFTHQGAYDGLWDRAALIAVPARDRPRYAAKLLDLMVPGGHGLLVTLDYDDTHIGGPPHAVPESEVRSLLGAWQMEVLSREATDRVPPRFFGVVPEVIETVWRVRA